MMPCPSCLNEQGISQGWLEDHRLGEGNACPTCEGCKEIPTTDAERQQLAQRRRREVQRAHQIKRDRSMEIRRQDAAEFGVAS